MATTAERARAYAFAKYYREAEKVEDLNGRVGDYFSRLMEQRNLVELKFYCDLFNIGQKHYSEYMDGAKTVIRTVIDDGKEVPYHFTQSGKPYKPAKEGDEPCFYQDEYPFGSEFYELLPQGVWRLSEVALSKMTKGKRAAYMERFYASLADDTREAVKAMDAASPPPAEKPKRFKLKPKKVVGKVLAIEDTPNDTPAEALDDE